MARPTDLTDPFVQTALVEAEQALDTGDYLRTVRKCVEVYSRIAAAARDDPEAAQPAHAATPARSVREGRRNALLPWPVRLGVGISFDEHDKPHLIFEKEFSMSEAASYFEFTLDVAMRVQRG